MSSKKRPADLVGAMGWPAETILHCFIVVVLQRALHLRDFQPPSAASVMKGIGSNSVSKIIFLIGT